VGVSREKPRESRFMHAAQIKKALTVNQVKIDIVKVEILELLVECSTDVVLAVIGVPQLGGDYKSY
jgi:predicted oxidoreductase